MQPLNVLVACEYSARVRDAFRRLGHNAVSCDLLPTDVPGPHYEGDVRHVLADPYRFFGGRIDLMIAHPECTFLTVSGARWLYEKGTRNPVPERWEGLRRGAEFFRELWEADVPRIAVENPVMMGHAKTIIGRGEPLEPTQYVHPWQFGHPEQKQTGLWLKGLPPLTPTKDVREQMLALPKRERQRIWSLPPGPDRWKVRSETFQGIADAMAAQWGGDAR